MDPESYTVERRTQRDTHTGNDKAQGKGDGQHHGKTEHQPPWTGRFKLELAETIEDLDDPEFLVSGAMPATGVGVLYGDTGSLKTFLALDLSLATALGQEWAGRKTKKGVAVYITGEASAGIRKRIKAHRVHNNLTSQGPFYLISERADLGHEPGDADGLITAIQAQGVDPVLMVIDTLSSMMFGADENKTPEMSTFFANCSQVGRAFGCFVLVVHHSGKDKGAGARGAPAALRDARGCTGFGLGGYIKVDAWLLPPEQVWSNRKEALCCELVAVLADVGVHTEQFLQNDNSRSRRGLRFCDVSGERAIPSFYGDVILHFVLEAARSSRISADP